MILSTGAKVCERTEAVFVLPKYARQITDWAFLGILYEGIRCLVENFLELYLEGVDSYY